jgi:diguanylate cyclase (GGDEF)-like protein
VLYADLDHLKEINDTQGHARGDEAIKAVAEALLQTFREADLVARLGGDEFWRSWRGSRARWSRPARASASR